MAETGTETREVRIAAVGDLHFGDDRAGTTRRQFAGISEEADILVLCGDLTTHGREDQIRALIEELSIVDIPIIAVLGNHDYESGKAELLQALLRESGVHVLDGDHVTIQGIGFAGTKGFAGGFGRGSLAPFGEQLIKDFVQGGIDEALKLENALRNLKTDRKVATVDWVLPSSAPDDSGGVISFPWRATKMFSPVHSATRPCLFSIRASSYPALRASTLASEEFT
jgi:hypothetical protein